MKWWRLIIRVRAQLTEHIAHRALLSGYYLAVCLVFALGGLACDDTQEAVTMKGGETAGAESEDQGVSGELTSGEVEPTCLAPYRCSESGARERCSAGVYEEDPCGEGAECQGEGECVTVGSCIAGASRCVDDANLEVCSAELEWESTPCDGGCVEDEESGETVARCAEPLCVPGQRICGDRDTVVECNASGSAFTTAERCQGRSTGQQCDRGACVPLCVLSEKVKTNIGCDYWAVDLDNAFVQGRDGFLDAASAPFAVVVSNPHPDYTGVVSVYDNERLVDEAILPPLGLHIFNLPRRDVEGTTLVPYAYRIRSGIPIIAYQFNPLDNEEVFSNDASLLLPSHVVGDDYLIMTREQSFDRLRGYFTVVGINDEPTTVTVTVSAPTSSGPVGEIPALSAGESYTVTLNAFDVLSLQTGTPGADLTGSRVTSDRPVVVFGGSEAANVPNTNHCVNIDPRSGQGVCEYDGETVCNDNYDCNTAFFNVCCADHLEQQLFPVMTWGNYYVATKSFDRGLENDYWRILASQDNTKVETIPEVAEIPTLNAGEWYEFGSREHFEIISDKPISVGQFLAGEHAPGPNVRGGLEPGDAGTGDPAFILAVPTAQFREDFVFLAPDKYAFDYVSVIAPISAQVFFDDLPVEVWEPVGESLMWQVARFPIGDGVHLLISDEPVSAIVYGYDEYVSYGYPGGLNLNVVDPETGMAMDTPDDDPLPDDTQPDDTQPDDETTPGGEEP